MLDDLGEYVRLETPSDDPAALVAGRDWVVSWIERRFGAPAAARTEPGAPHGDTVVLDYPGTGAGTVVILAHYDTVWPVGTLAELPFSVDGDVIRGPGVFDMKAGLVQAVWAIRAIRATGLACPPVRLVLNGDEEIGSPASRPVIEKRCRDAAAVLVFEASADGAVKTSRKGVGLFDVTCSAVRLSVPRRGPQPADPAVFPGQRRDAHMSKVLRMCCAHMNRSLTVMSSFRPGGQDA
jgi:glutamate carboxypeptidase